MSWLVRQATGWPDHQFAPREEMWEELLASNLPLTSDHLVAMVNGDGPPSITGVRQLLAHPCAGLDVVAALLDDALGAAGWVHGDQSGLPQPYAQGLRARRAATAAVLAHQDQRDWVRAVTASRRQGITHWHPDWAAVSGLARGHGEAQENWRTAMAAIRDTGDPALWRAACTRGPNVNESARLRWTPCSPPWPELVRVVP